MTVFNALSQKELFLSEVRREISAHPPGTPEVFSADELALLRAPVQAHLHATRWAEKARPFNARVHWEDVELRRSPDAGWMKIDCYQFNSVPAPARLADMRAKLLGLVPFEGRDKSQDGHGSMRITVASFLLGDEQGPAMDASSLVTILAEALLIPSIAVQPYVRWEPVDDAHARATLSHEGTEVHGTFAFDSRGLMTEFVTDDRFYSDGRSAPVKFRWLASCSEYRELGGVLAPSRFSAWWELPDRELEYYRGAITGMDFDVRDFGVIERDGHGA